MYAYAENNPINWIDPKGLTAMEWAIPAATIISQLDTPLPGPADAIGGAIIGIALLYDTWPGMMNESNESDEGGEECEVPTTPPDGLVENPHRPGSWGEIGPDGKFEEKWRRDKGRPEIKRGHGSQDHIHVNGKW